MRLIDTHTGLFHRVDQPQDAQYAILSHVWNGHELSFQDMTQIHVELSKSPATLSGQPDFIFDRMSQKVRGFCYFAREQGYHYGWADTCCIDQTSSAELSEAINSMYAWYEQASVCYVYLADVPFCADVASDAAAGIVAFRYSRWFKRGWTLQELIAPDDAVFLADDWSVLGTKESLATTIQEVTGIGRDILDHTTPVTSVSVALRMSWAALRRTTRPEDHAYCLMGIFGVHMPTIYGEGSHAFVRLQEEILKQVPDQTLFAWGSRVLDYNWQIALADASGDQRFTMRIREDPTTVKPLGTKVEGTLFASSPAEFARRKLSPAEFARRKSGDANTSVDTIGISYASLSDLLSRELPLPDYTITCYGTHARLPLIPLPSPTRHVELVLAILGCRDENGRILALFLSRQERSSRQYSVGAFIDVPVASGSERQYTRLAALSMAQVDASKHGVVVQDVYIDHGLSRTPRYSHPSAIAQIPRTHLNRMAEVTIAPWCLEMLQSSGYKLSSKVPKGLTCPAPPTFPVLLDNVLVRNDICVRLSVCHCCRSDNPALRVAVSYFWRNAPISADGPPLYHAASPVAFTPTVVCSHGYLPGEHVETWRHRSPMNATATFAISSRVRGPATRYLRLTLRGREADDPQSAPHMTLDVEMTDCEIRSGLFDVALYGKAHEERRRGPRSERLRLLTHPYHRSERLQENS